MAISNSSSFKSNQYVQMDFLFKSVLTDCKKHVRDIQITIYEHSTRSEILHIYWLNSGNFLRHRLLYYPWVLLPLKVLAKLNEGILKKCSFSFFLLNRGLVFQFLTQFWYSPVLPLYRAYITNQNTLGKGGPMALEGFGRLVIFDQFWSEFEPLYPWKLERIWKKNSCLAADST